LPCTTSGQETERVYSFNPAAHMGQYSAKLTDRTQCLFPGFQHMLEYMEMNDLTG